MLAVLKPFYWICALVSTSGALALEWGGYDGDDVTLPCLPESDPGFEYRRGLWWTFNDTFIGSYTPWDGFKPPSTKYHVDTLSGHLLVREVRVGQDNGLYLCTVVSVDEEVGETTHDVVNLTATVTLTVGRPLSEIHVVSNGSYIEGCHEHIGLGPVSCSVTSYPQANFSWSLEVADDAYCQSMIDDANTTCWLREDGLWNCSTTLLPISLCFGEYKCRAELRLGENLQERHTECVYGKEYYVGAVLDLLAIILISVLCLVVAVVLIAGIIFLICGGGAVLCASCGIAAGAGCFACCKDKSKQVDPRETNDVIQGQGVYMDIPASGAGDPMETVLTMESPPPYSQIDQKTSSQF